MGKLLSHVFTSFEGRASSLDQTAQMSRANACFDAVRKSREDTPLGTSEPACVLNLTTTQVLKQLQAGFFLRDRGDILWLCVPVTDWEPTEQLEEERRKSSTFRHLPQFARHFTPD